MTRLEIAPSTSMLMPVVKADLGLAELAPLARDAQVAYLVEGAYEEYARREDPNAATYASLPTRRLDIQLAPGVLSASAGAVSVTP